MFCLEADESLNIDHIENPKLSAIMFGGLIGQLLGMIFGLHVWQMVSDAYFGTCSFFDVRLSKLLIQHFDANPLPQNKVGDYTATRKGFFTSRPSGADLSDSEYIDRERKGLRVLKIVRHILQVLVIPFIVAYFWIFLKAIQLVPEFHSGNEILAYYGFVAGFILALIISHLILIAVQLLFCKICGPRLTCKRSERLLIIHFDESLPEVF